ncbi:SLC13 family permease [Nonomuraea sp. NPDC055795]
MSAELLSILALILMFVVATAFPVNLGALALVGAFLVGTLAAGMGTDDIIGAFPGSLFVILVGVTLLFAIATNNGTVDWLVRAAVHLVRGRIVAIPLVIFAIAALLTAVGAPAPAVAAILAPIAYGFAAQYKIHSLLIGLMVAHGTQAGAFSPISVLGGIVNGVTKEAGLPSSNLVLFLSSFAFNAAAAVIVFLLFGGPALARRTASDGPSEEETLAEEVPGVSVSGAPGSGASGSGASVSGGGGTATIARPGTGLRLTVHQALTLAGIVGLCAGVLAFKLDLGLTAVTVAVILSLTSPKANKGAVERVAWPTVLLICGVVTYVGVLQEIGTIDSVTVLGPPPSSRPDASS